MHFGASKITIGILFHLRFCSGKLSFCEERKTLDSLMKRFASQISMASHLIDNYGSTS